MVKSKQRGFTLIELVVVIVILGILAAFAVPRFMGLEGEARVSSVKSMGGTLLSAAAMAHAVCAAQGCANGANLTIDGQPVTFANGYPNAATISNLVQNLDGFTPTTAAGRRRFTKTGAAANCYVEYSPATAARAPILVFQGALSPNGGTNEVTITNNLRTACR